MTDAPRHSAIKKRAEHRPSRFQGWHALIVLIPVFVVGASIAVAFFALTSSSDPPEHPAATTEDTREAVITNEPAETPIRQSDVIDPNAPRIYLTFDDGPSPNSTIQVLDTLEKYRVPATFFIAGVYAEQWPEPIVRQFAEGHVVANHGYSHYGEVVYASADAFMESIEQTERILTTIIGVQPPRILRFPYGSAAAELERNPQLLDEIKQRLAAGGWRFFDWTVAFNDCFEDYTPQPGELASQLNAQIDEQVQKGEKDIIVLGHDTDHKHWAGDDLHLVIEHCLAKGYVFMPIDERTPEVQFR